MDSNLQFNLSRMETKLSLENFFFVLIKIQKKRKSLKLG